MKLIFKLIIVISVLTFVSCADSSNKGKSLIPTTAESQSMKHETNAIHQSLPTLMVIPSDALLKKNGCFTKIRKHGKTSYFRNYTKALVESDDIKFAIAAIEEQFSNVGYPLENLEQNLKMITNENAMDAAENINRDLRAELMNTVKPDYIIELDYNTKPTVRGANIVTSLTYIVKCINVYSNKVVAAVTRANAGSGCESVPEIIKNDFSGSISELQQGINTSFADILANGIEITLRVAVLRGSGVALDDYCGNEDISEQVINWLKKNTIHSTYKMLKNTRTEMRFTNLRIPIQDEDGNSYTAYDFAKDLKNAMRNGCRLKVTNKTQSIGDAYIQIVGTY